MHRKFPLPLVFLIGAVLLGANAAWGWPYAIRFTYAPLNNWSAALLALSVPTSLAFLRASFVSRLGRIATLATVVGLAIPAILFALLTILDGPPDELQDSLAVGPTAYRIYMRDPAAATSQPFTFLRKELDSHLGFKLVRTIWSADVYGAARLHLINESTLEVEIDSDFYRKRIAL